jgi:hypothetical protein
MDSAAPKTALGFLEKILTSHQGNATRTRELD